MSLEINRVLSKLQAPGRHTSNLALATHYYHIVLPFLLNLSGGRRGQTLKDSFVSGSKNDSTK